MVFQYSFKEIHIENKVKWNYLKRDSYCEVIMCFGTILKLSVDLTVIENDVGFGIFLMSLS